MQSPAQQSSAQQATAQQEALRQQYLEAIGITTWLPTQALPGAANRVQWRWQPAAVSTLDSSTDTTPNTTPHTTAAGGEQAGAGARHQASHGAAKPVNRAQDVLAQMRADAESSTGVAANPSSTSQDVESPAAKRTDPKATRSAQPQAGTASSAEAGQEQPALTQSRPVSAPPRFRLLLGSYGDCLVACDMPQQRQTQGADADRHYHLLANILKSIGLGQGEAHFHQFDWPFINSPHIDQGPDVARQGLADVIGRMSASAAVPLLLFGELAVSYVLPPGSQAAQAPWQLGSRWCLAAPSLHELMGVPGLKRELWQQLQQLQQQLTSAQG